MTSFNKMSHYIIKKNYLNHNLNKPKEKFTKQITNNNNK